MPKFVKKPVVIDAMQWTGDNYSDIAEFVNDGSLNRIGELIYIVTLEWTMIAHPGDWIIRGIHGEYYPCKNDIFIATYDSIY